MAQLEFQRDVAGDEESFRQFMLWAAADDDVVFEDLLIATKSVYNIMGQPLPCGKETWAELVEIANMVEVSLVSDSELEYALEVFSKAYDLYRAELQRLDHERDEAERMSSQRISEEIMAEDDGFFVPPGEEEVVTKEISDAEYFAELERWEKLVDDTRSQINSTKAEFDELMEELGPSKEEREQALSRLRVLEKDAKRRRGRLERYQRGRISDAKAEEISNLERELVGIEDEQADWESRLTIAQERIDQRIGLCAEKRGQFLHIKEEVGSLLSSLPSQERAPVTEALAGELHDLDEILEDVDEWLSELTSEGAGAPGDSASIIDTPPPSGEAARERVESISTEVVERTPEETGELTEEPPVVFMDAEVRRMLSELPMERPPEEELLLRIDSLQQELINRENNILKLEHTIEELMEDKGGSTTAVELERNKYKLELNKIQDELTEKQGLLNQYLDVIRDLESKMEGKDKELDETMRLNRRKTTELRQKEAALETLERDNEAQPSQDGRAPPEGGRPGDPGARAAGGAGGVPPGDPGADGPGDPVEHPGVREGGPGAGDGQEGPDPGASQRADTQEDGPSYGQGAGAPTHHLQTKGDGGDAHPQGAGAPEPEDRGGRPRGGDAPPGYLHRGPDRRAQEAAVRGDQAGAPGTEP